METTKVFEYNWKEFCSKSKLIINQGGTRSGKTYSILQAIFLIAKYAKKPLVISVVSYALPHLKLGAMRDFDSILLSQNIIPDTIKNKTDCFYKINGSIIEFFGVDNLAKVHGPARDMLFINEANFIKKDVFDQLAIRTKSTIFIDYNPSREFWVHTELIQKQKHSFIKSTYNDNNFLTAEQKARIEAKKDNKNWWKVYGLGELGQLEDCILTNWEYGEFDNSLPFGFGLDFGVKDPDALVKVAIDRQRNLVYCQEVIYKSGLSTNNLKDILIQHCQKRMIVADSANPRTILDLQGHGLNILGVKKGAGSVNEGIKIMQDFKLIVHSESYNLARELNAWVWLDKKGEIPLDAENHLIDAVRYYCTTVIKPKSNFTGHKIF